jgi:phenylalanine-4-hydroxylase
MLYEDFDKNTKLYQKYDNYTADDFKIWKLLFERQINLLPNLASQAYLDGIKLLEFGADAIPNFAHINQILGTTTGWQVIVVPGLIPQKTFFELLAEQKFPSSTWLRKIEELDYLEEPDMFHDVFGHLPLLTNQYFCDFLRAYSLIALKYIDNPLAVKLLGRLYWFTVEFGLIEKEEGLKIYGAGILSSSGESVFCLGDEPARYAFDVEKIMLTDYYIDHFQDKYFVIQSYKQLFDALPEVERVLEKYALETVVAI